MAEIENIPGEHIPQGVIPQKGVGEYLFLIRSYAIYIGQGKPLDGVTYFHDWYVFVSFSEKKQIGIWKCSFHFRYSDLVLRDADRIPGISSQSCDDVFPVSWSSGTGKNL